jgi:hypothetical protein
MVRAAFRIESTGRIVSCMLNPSQLVFRRSAGVKYRRSVGGAVAAGRSSDQPLHFTGAGTTELTLDLLFDVNLQSGGAGGTPETDVTGLTRPLWELAEKAEVEDGVVQPPIVRFIWGKAWNFPAVVVAAAERFDAFDSTGAPRRSWLRLRLLRVDEPDGDSLHAPVPLERVPPVATESAPSELGDFPLPDETDEAEPLTDDDAEEERVVAGQRLDVLAEAHLGSASRWRDIANANGIEDVLRVPLSALLSVPVAASPGASP